MARFVLPALSHSLRKVLLVTLVLVVTLLGINQPLITQQAPQGLVSFQLAVTADLSGAILNSWGADGVRWAKAALWLEFVFIGFYLAALQMLTRQCLKDRPGIREQKLGRWLKGMFVVAAISDVGENLLLLSNLSTPADPVSLAATILAIIKFTVLTLGLAGIVLVRASHRPKKV